MNRFHWILLFLSTTEAYRSIGWMDRIVQPVCLDIGCGTGMSSHLLQQKNPEAVVIGIDHDEIVLRQGRQSFPHIGFYPMDAQDMRFDNEMFDLVQSHYVFSSMTPLMTQNTLHEIKRILRPKGVLQIMEYQKSFMQELFETPDRLHHFPSLNPCFDGDWLMEEVQTHGFMMVRSEFTKTSYKTLFQKKKNVMDPRVFKYPL